MTVVLPMDSVPTPDGDHRPPFAVAGTVHGRPVEALVTGLAEVLARIAAWTGDDPEAIGCWGLRHDYSESLIMPVRRRRGSVDEWRRVVHLVRLCPGEPHGGTLTAMCGEQLSLVAVDAVTLGQGMPCELCLTRPLSVSDGQRLQGAIVERLDRRIG